ncbi:CocE/NonD family hydrolase [Conexibacter sp. SYSU D00693]|uniref:CocE/NonD family hydrolase n=1 Tax=Conexibacter sp. SYSU D00693 TaxID=2812560 RepID=UPI00196AC6D3|nr:CocE/NonD family hydrolase [Conexibacter sp. SYSU D00693]
MRRAVLAVLAATAVVLAAAGPVFAATLRQDRARASDGVTLQTTLTGQAPLLARPTLVEFSPYGRASGTLDAGPAYNHLLVQIRGTGDSDGSFDALGPRTQRDVAEVLRWACDQPWSAGRLALRGFSASAITIYNSLHLELPCVEAAVLGSGTFELYRDLLVPGGVNNLVPGAGVMGLIGVPALAQGLDRIRRDPGSALGVLGGLLKAGLDELAHPTLDGWWRARGFRGDVNDLPVLMVGSFFDVESRGAFQAFQALRDDGAHLLVVGAHDGAPKGTDGGLAASRAWLDHHVRGVDNGAEREPRVRMLLADGDREDFTVGGKVVARDAGDWPVPGTRWERLALDARRSGTSLSPSAGTLTLGAPAKGGRQSFAALPSIPLQTDPPNAGIVGGFGINALTSALPVLSDMTLSEPLGLSYTTAPLRRDVVAAGPAAVEVDLATTAPETAVWAVVSDVDAAGVPHPVASGRLLSSFPEVDEARSLRDASGALVQPYGDFSRKRPTAPGRSRRLQVELWPIGNRFRAGHRIRLTLVGASLASLPTLPGVTTVRLGGERPSRLLLPVLPESDLPAALGQARRRARRR